MITSQSGKSVPVNGAFTPTECLTKGRVGQLSPSGIVSLILSGFELDDVIAMISLSKLYSTPQITERIVGKTRTLTRRQRNKDNINRLSAHQSAVAFQYAKILEHANFVFGKQTTAEDWLGRPCPHLDGLIPLDLIDNAIGFQVVKDYLERVELGVYQ
ncbi:DUF2384 domain-containing protein [Pseudomonas chlororaphis]|uniref:antitoxin Xre/MbcA/ParS toxin-binding domain-containing protein n=1 Tax=Pseudomonas chlororaphis TaxID=587753 RepID=UPI001B30B98B|nr:antitoxin Xre/MbcA/ParS toxin-binding domain-containing protein [Pseudomonas chlororaphis]MBP5060564.1 DUF2384 domain-containing protein [Pseudomonas chlororaphis]QTT97513.1 DUF2384 domain-containing protein [Pseudomonas chlororaphis]